MKKSVKSVQSHIFKNNVFNFIMLVFTSLLQTAGVIVISLMIEKIMAVATAKDMDALYEQGIMIAVLSAIFIVDYLLVVCIRPRYQKKALLQYKSNIYEKILNKDMLSFNEHNISTYISALTNDVNTIETNYLYSAFELITQVTLFVTTVVIMFVYSPYLTLAAIGLSLLPFIPALLIGKKMEFHEKTISDQNASFMHFVKDNLIGFSVVKLFRAEKKIKDLFDKNNTTLEDKKASKAKTLAIMEMVQTVLSCVAQFGVFFIGAYISISTGEIAPSVIILFVQLMNYIISPLTEIPTLLSKLLACKPLFKKMEEMVAVKEPTDDRECIETFEDIVVTDLKKKYDDKIVLDGVSHKFERNKSYAIVGTSGSGKSTLLNLLIGRGDEYEGSIKYNGVDLKETHLDSLFELSSFVEQNVFVFDDSILNNITMYSEVDEELLDDVIIKSGIKNIIDEKGRDYTCGENGCNLSGGEKQRISIARALLKKSQLLFLDEATSALDNETHSIVTDNLLAIEGATKIMITHRLDEENMRKFDEIIVMKNGKIAEFGNYDELMKNDAIFKSLVEFSK